MLRYYHISKSLCAGQHSPALDSHKTHPARSRLAIVVQLCIYYVELGDAMCLVLYVLMTHSPGLSILSIAMNHSQTDTKCLKTDTINSVSDTKMRLWWSENMTNHALINPIPCAGDRVTPHYYPPPVVRPCRVINMVVILIKHTCTILLSPTLQVAGSISHCDKDVGECPAKFLPCLGKWSCRPCQKIEASFCLRCFLWIHQGCNWTTKEGAM